MTKTLPTLGELELAVLQVVWKEQPCTERQVWDAIRADREVARTTVLKTIQRLEAKEVLVRLPGTTPVQFRAAVQSKRLLPSLVEKFVRSTLGGSHAPLVAYLAGSEKLSEKDLAALRAIARKLEESGP